MTRTWQSASLERIIVMWAATIVELFRIIIGPILANAGNVRNIRHGVGIHALARKNLLVAKFSTPKSSRGLFTVDLDGAADPGESHGYRDAKIVKPMDRGTKDLLDLPPRKQFGSLKVDGIPGFRKPVKPSVWRHAGAAGIPTQSRLMTGRHRPGAEQKFIP